MKAKEPFRMRQAPWPSWTAILSLPTDLLLSIDSMFVDVAVCF